MKIPTPLFIIMLLSPFLLAIYMKYDTQVSKLTKIVQKEQLKSQYIVQVEEQYELSFQKVLKNNFGEYEYNIEIIFSISQDGKFTYRIESGLDPKILTKLVSFLENLNNSGLENHNLNKPIHIRILF